ncbi:MAG: phosphoenolpyruvate carboxykinase (GTP) [Candidatus Micrarchaeia archaeon]
MLTREQKKFLGNLLSNKIEKIAKITKPKEVFILNGEKKEKELLIEKLLQRKKIIKLKWRNCYLYRTKVEDSARSEASTYVCTRKKEDAGPTNNWVNPKRIMRILLKFLKNSMNEKTMYVIPYILGPEKSPYSRIGVIITDNEYVALNELIIAKVTKEAITRIKNGEKFVFGIHSNCNLDVKNRYIVHFPEKNEIISINTEYGGNALLTKKCHSLRIASFQARNEGWLAEHMMAVEIRDPKNKTFGLVGAFPSMAGKTNFATMKLSKKFKDWKVKLLSDDIVWIHERNRKLYAINPEYGIFGVASGTNKHTNPNIMKIIKEDTIFTNVAITDDLQPWWEGLAMNKKIIDFQGNPYNKNSLAAHPNSRFTTSIIRYPYLSNYFFKPSGLPIHIIIFGCRRKDLIPLVFETFSWEEGVLFGAMLRTETTSAVVEGVGELQHDPMAMRAFCGYNMGEYFRHWLWIGKRINKKQKIFIVNWFRRDKNGKFIWPGFEKNMYVVEWMIRRYANKINGIKTPIGIIPDYNTSNFGISKNKFKQLFEIDKEKWLEEIQEAKNYFSKFNKFPKTLFKKLQELEKRFNI